MGDWSHVYGGWHGNRPEQPGKFRIIVHESVIPQKSLKFVIPEQSSGHKRQDKPAFRALDSGVFQSSCSPVWRALRNQCV